MPLTHTMPRGRSTLSEYGVSPPLGSSGKSKRVNLPVAGSNRAIADSGKAAIHRLPSSSVRSRRGPLNGVATMVIRPVSGSIEPISSVCRRANQTLPSGVMSMP